jgi:hypothetical protein
VLSATIALCSPDMLSALALALERRLARGALIVSNPTEQYASLC